MQPCSGCIGSLRHFQQLTKINLERSCISSTTSRDRPSHSSNSLTNEHESSQFRTGNWLRGRLFLFDLGFYSYRRFALIDENDGFFVSRLKTNANPRIVGERRKWRGRAISLTGTRLQDRLSKLTREHIDVTGEFEFKRRKYGERQSQAIVEFRVVGVETRTPTTTTST